MIPEERAPGVPTLQFIAWKATVRGLVEGEAEAWVVDFQQNRMRFDTAGHCRTPDHAIVSMDLY
jgi:hypothetical protein